jgi:hypothetical protein
VRYESDVTADDDCGRVCGGIAGSNDWIVIRDDEDDDANSCASGETAILLM